MSRRKLHLGENFSMPADAVTRTFGFVGQRGTGKSSGAAVVIEEVTTAGGRAVVLDPVGAHWGLTRPGDGPGIEGVVIGGEHGDLPLEEASGQLVADLVVNSDYPLVVIDLKLLRKQQQIRFVADFVEHLYHSNRDPLLVAFEEAHRFIPQNPREAGNLPRAMGAIEDVVMLGRSRGLGALIISQRPANVAKNVLEQVETMVMFRVVGPRDRKAIRDWVEANGDPESEKEVLASVSKLKPGQAWVWSPAFLEVLVRVHFRFRNTFDSGATPEVGQRELRAPKDRAPVDLDVLREQMKEVAERAVANDPEVLQKQVRELERELDEAERELTAARQEPKEISILTEADRNLLAEVQEEAGKQVKRTDHLAQEVEELSKIVGARAEGLDRRIGELLSKLDAEEIAREEAHPAEATRTVKPEYRPGPGDPQTPYPPAAGEVNLKEGAWRMVRALAQLHPRPLSRPQLCTLAGVSARSGSDYVSAMKRESIVRDEGRDIAITDKGLSTVPDSVGKAPPSTAEVRALWVPSLKGGAVKMLDYLIELYPAATTRSALMEVAGVSERSCSDYVSSLKRRGLAEEPNRGELQAGSILFL